MKNITTWSPDTCDCVLEYEWDTDDAPETRTHSIKNIKKACPRHSSETNNGNHYGRVMDENQGKNMAMSQIMDNNPTLVDETTDGEGNVSKKFKAGKSPDWSFDDTGKLTIKLNGVTTNQKNAIKAQALQNINVPLDII